MSWMEACEGSLSRKPHIVPQPSSETNAQKSLKSHSRLSSTNGTRKAIVYLTGDAPVNHSYLAVNK